MTAALVTVVEVPPPDVGGHAPGRRTWLIAIPVVAALAVWIAGATAPRVPAFDWLPLDGPPGPVNLDSLAPTGDGLAVLSGVAEDGVTLWVMGADRIWSDVPMEGSPSQLSGGEGRLVAYRSTDGTILEPRSGSWVEVKELSLPEQTRTRQSSGRPSVVPRDGGIVAMSLFGNVWWSADGGEFTLSVEDPAWGPGVEQPFRSSCSPPYRGSPDVPPMVSADGRLVALVPANRQEPFGIWPVCEPEVWVSEDGLTWSSSPSGLTDGAYVYDLAWRDGLFVAVGGTGVGEPAAWVSSDGATWDVLDRLPSLSQVEPVNVESGPAGWVILGSAGGPGPAGWTSADGRCWEPLPVAVTGSDAVVSESAIFVVDRVTFPSMWVGAPTGSDGVCP